MKTHPKPGLGHPCGSLTALCVAVALATAGITAPVSCAAAADLPQAGQVIGGQATIKQQGKQMEVNTSGARTAINWQSFNVGPDHKITFNQPDGKSVTLNRVMGSDPSKIYGAVTSNGQLILVNPNGVWVGPNAHIASSALIASAGFLTEEQARQFAATGKLDIQLTGSVTNQGRITVHDNGMVALLGAQVSNAGVIQARKGTVQLATGPQATLDFHGDGLLNIAVSGNPGEPGSVNADVSGGVHNSGEIDAAGGVVSMSAQRAAKHLDSVINLGGNVSADSVSNDGGTIVLGSAAHTNVTGNLSAKGSNGGSIKVLGDAVNVAGNARIDATGTQGAGGKVLVGGSFQGKSAEPAAKSTHVAKGAALKADGTTDGGQVVVWSDGSTHFAGSASATGKAHGGVVETSGKQLTVTADANVNTRGEKASGTWLLAPQTVNINATGDDNLGSGSVAASAVVNGLAQGNVVIQATETLNVNAPIIATNLATVNNDGRVSSSTLALIGAGNAGLVSTFDGNDKSHANGAVNIKAPILLKDGNLYISATGDIRLIDNAPAGSRGDAAYGQRAIIDVGSGIAWLKTANTASIFQQANTALIGSKVALEGASVRMDSGLNFAGELAGKASNGIFTFSQTNASGNGPDTSKTISAPLTGETLSGVKAYALTQVGTQVVIGNNETDRTVTLSPGNGQTFDYVVFEALNFHDENGNEIPQADVLRYLDSSDYLIYGISFRDTDNALWQFKPNPADVNAPIVTRNGITVDVPVGFSLSPVGGTLAVGVKNQYFENYWGVDSEYIPGAANQQEIQYKPSTDTSQQLIFKLQSETDAVLARIGWLADDKPWVQTTDGKPVTQQNLFETARMQFLSTQDKTDTNVTISGNQAHIIATPENVSREYGEQNPALTQNIQYSGATTDQVRGIDQYVDARLGRPGVIQSSPSTAADAQSNVGEYAIKGGLSGDAFAQQRYTLQNNPATLTVTPAQLTVTANDKSKTYGDSDPALDYGVSGAKLGHNAANLLQGTLARQAGEDVRTPGYSINQGSVGLNNDQGSNYVLQFIEGTLTITPAALTLTAENTGKVYGDLDPSLGYQLSGLKGQDQAGEVLNSGALQRQAGEDVVAGGYNIGQGSIGLNQGKGQNYILSYQAGTFTITPATLLVRADDKTKVYGQVDPALSYQVSGLKRGDQQAAVLNDGSLQREAGETVKAGGYAIGNVDLASTSQNYILNFQDGVFTITPAALQIDAGDHSKVYGEVDPGLTYRVSGLVNGDSAADVLNGGAVQRDSGENVGRYSVKQGDLGLNGGKGGNYILTFNDGQLAITPAELTVTADHQTKVYGDLDPLLTYSVQGLKRGDSASAVVAGALDRQSGENVRDGGYAITQGNVVLSSGNYSMVFKEGNLQVTPAPLDVHADSKTKVLGAADPQLTYQVSGLKNGDTAAVAQGSLLRAPGEDAGAYGIGQGQAYQAGTNYTVTFHDGTLTITGPLAPIVPVSVEPAPVGPLPVEPVPNAVRQVVPVTAQSPGNTRCTALESPSAVSANYSVTPAVARTYAVQLICKPRAYGDTSSTVPDLQDVLDYANSHFKDGKFIVPDWNRSVIPHDLQAPQQGGK
ncbi:MBG domain-containing protein [Pseudomonas alkylphenolica]|uniref:MBG domain-containing protein n=1 Tax=Pseudomonas alkylphenolica TaxID=237609 RepID=UPI0018D8937B|nr:MBG domain-containing protein [Pseudomonas alkylphenolica]MBH3428914.1 filamentous hemagglutinin N-terminal domain-containing protein [Pseudomonas alkylphenolica]